MPSNWYIFKLFFRVTVRWLSSINEDSWELNFRFPSCNTTRKADIKTKERLSYKSDNLSASALSNPRYDIYIFRSSYWSKIWKIVNHNTFISTRPFLDVQRNMSSESNIFFAVSFCTQMILSIMLLDLRSKWWGVLLEMVVLLDFFTSEKHYIHS